MSIELEGFSPMKVSKYPSYIMTTDDSIVGFEVHGSARKFFWIPKGDTRREYYAVLPTWIQDIVASTDITANLEVEEANKQNWKLHEEKAVSKASDHTQPSLPNATGGIIPSTITNPLFLKWQKMPVEERLIMLQTTDSRYIEERKGRGGRMYKYVQGHYMIMCANMAFGFCWSSQVQQWEKSDTEIICMGYIEAELNGKLVRRYAVGQHDIAKTNNVPVCVGDNYKAAETDMIKKALSSFGIAKDVYSGEYD